MKDWWKIILRLAIAQAEAAGQEYQDKDDNDTGTDDVIGDGLVYLAKFGRWLIAGAKGPAPSVPAIVAKQA
jgi:hypothetical protein